MGSVLESNVNVSREEARRRGGAATAIKLRRQAVDAYYANPNICAQCGKVIEVCKRVSETRKRKFCTMQCAAIFNNSLRPKKPIVIKEKKPRARIPIVNDITKGELFERSKNWQGARSAIQKQARSIFFMDNSKPKSCAICGYDKHVEVCHIKSVSSFPSTARLSEISSIDNLIGLCPTHHWEFDNGVLTL